MLLSNLVTPSLRAARPLLCVALAWLALGSEAARAQSPYDARAHMHAKRALAQGHDASAAVPLLELLRQADRVSPTVARTLYQRLASTKALDVRHRLMMARAVALAMRRTGDPAASERAFDTLGYLRAFRVIGPFDNEGKRGFDYEHGPERERTAAVKLDEAYDGRERPVRWRKLPDVVRAGYVDFEALFRPNENVCGLAETSIELEEALPLTLWLGGAGATKLYFNGVEVIRDPAYRGFGHDRSVAAVAGRKGPNRVLVKSCTASGAFGIALRVADARGEPLVVAHDPAALDAIAPPAEPVTLAKGAPSSVLAELERAAAGERPSAAALENLARFLSYAQADDQAERRAAQLALRAAELAPTAGRYLFASSLAEERYEKMRLLEKARSLAPNDPELAIASAHLVSRGPGAERALRALDGLTEKPARSVAHVDALELRSRLLRQLGLDESAEQAAKSARKQAPEAEALLELALEFAASETRKDEQLELARTVLAQRYDHFGARRTLLEAAAAKGDEVAALEHLDAIRALYPSSEQRAVYLADMYDALGRDDLELATLTRALEIAPESANLYVRQGRALLRDGRTEAAAESLQKALAFAPQDAVTRELLEQIVPEERLDEGYAVDKDVLLARRSDQATHPVTLLTDLTVATVFENGLGSRFVQFAAQVHDEEGARRMRARSIQFDPETQRVSVRLARVYRADGRVLEATETYEEQLGEPWYRVYYDTRALVVVFPDLEPGDSVELRYRVDDVAPRNLFADYFGDLHVFAGGEPRKQVEYVLITPAARRFFIHEPALPLERDERVQGTQRIQRFRAKDVPALHGEPNMPGMTEVAPYLHVSTYENWESVGRWWWGLVRDQLYADAHLKGVVAELKRGAKDDDEIVRRIYGWVVKNTRYVALEFGIHGFLPYRVPEIVRRGFGDCKDKASLIYTMLREAGIDARLVLVRTRQNGHIDPEPASLAVFDHAIAYVPKLDLYLDGTAEHSGTRELPAADQGVMVLVVGPDGAELKQTPVLPPESNLRERAAEILLAADGSAQLSAKERIAGVEAARYRSTFQAAGTQRDRLERQLSSSLPGLSLEQHAFTGLDDIERDVTLSYRAKAPLVARPQGDELRIPGSALSDLLRELASSPTRRYPLDLGTPRVYREERTVVPPPGHVVHALPKGGRVASRFGQMVVENKQRGQTVVSKTSFTLAVARIDAADYAEFRRFVEQAEMLVRQRITFAKEAP